MTAAPTQMSPSPVWLVLGVLGATCTLLVIVFAEGLVDMERVWGQPEYSYAYIVPFMSLYVLSLRLPDVRTAGAWPSWAGPAVVALALTAYLFGELSSIFVIVQYGFVLAIWGLALSLVGFRGVKIVWASLAFLLFLVPLPRFIQFNLSSQLQLVSSELGTLMLRMVGVPVFLEGNVIDLGSYKLQVVEACSGLRYLFPLMSFGFLCAILFRGAVWKKWLIFLSSVPITVVMNSFRIAVTGLLVNRFGTEAAEGFLHYFEGWVIFVACLAIMFGEMAVLARASGLSVDDALDVQVPSLRGLGGWWAGWHVPGPLWAALVLLAVGAGASFAIGDRTELTPRHEGLARFPLLVGEWRGVEGELGAQELEQLKLTDYTLVNYADSRTQDGVQLYVAYYASQSKGASAHSPRSCLPGGGWRFEEFESVNVPDVQPDGGPVPVNRALVSMGSQRLLVYYWFMQRGRLLTNEYMVKWYIFWDALTRRRTDGAMIRLVVPVQDRADVVVADDTLARFMRAVYPALYYHLPQDAALPEDGLAAL